MARRSVFRWIVLAILTAALVASLVTMYVVEGGFDEVWTYATLALYGVSLLMYWLIGAGAKKSELTDAERDEVAQKVAAALAASSTRSSQTTVSEPEPEPEIVVEPSRTEPIVFPTPAPVGYQFRGYTLYARGDSRFFSKGTPPGAQAIVLPEGYEAKWDDKKQKPVLVEVVPPGEEEPEIVLDSAKKACSAMVAPGEFCENFTKEGSKYCAKHADYRGGDELFDVRKPGVMTQGKTQRFGAPEIEVHVAKPTAKPLKFKRGPEPNIEVRVAKPSNTKSIEYKRGKAVEIQIDRRASKPLKLRPAGNVEVEVDRREPEKPLKFGKPNEPVVRLARPSAGKPVKFGQPNEPVVRVAKPSAGKAVRFGRGEEPTLKVAKPPAPKPLRLKTAPEPTIREDQATPGKPKGKPLPPSTLVVKQPTALNKPPPKGKQLPASELVVKSPTNTPMPKGKRLPPSELVVRQPTALNKPPPKGKQLPASELVVKSPTNKPMPKGKQLPASDVVVKRPGVAKPAAPLKVGQPEIVVRSASAARPAAPAKARKQVEPEIVVVKDTKRRSLVGMVGESPKKK